MWLEPYYQEEDSMKDPKKITLSEAILAYKDAVDRGDKRAQAMMESAARGNAEELVNLAKHLKTQAKHKK